MTNSCAEQRLSTSIPSNSKNLQLTWQTPRHFGYAAGDIILHVFDITKPSGTSINTNHLPATGALTDWLDVLEVKLTKQSDSRSRLIIQYQVSKSVKATEWLEIPSFQISTNNQPQTDTMTVPAWKFTYNTIIPSNISDSEIIAQPAQQPKPVKTRDTLTRMICYLAGALLCLGYIMWRAGHLQIGSHQSSPFQTAIQRLNKLPEHPSSESQLQQAFRIVHTAFNQTAGETVLESQIDLFCEKQPKLAPLKAETVTFFELSRQIFYESNTPSEQQTQNNHPLKMLKQLCLRYARLQKQR